jgi:CRP-like cAMP-binding protein
MEEMLLDIRTVINKCRLDLDPTEFSAYMKELFQREILLDRRRMRKLMSEKLPASSETEAKRTEPARPGRSPGERGDLGQNLRPSSWRLQELGEYASAQGNLEPRILRFSVGKSIFSQGDPGTEIYVIQKGKVRIVLHAGKIEQTLAILSEGDFFGESALVDDFQRSVSALAEEDCELICLEREVFATLINHELARKIVFNLIQKLRDSRELVEGTLLQDDLSRLIFGLMSLQRRASAENGKEIDLGELKALFRLDNDDQIKKYLAKLESLDIVQGDEKVVQVKKVDTLRNILTVLCGEGKCGFKL